MSDVYIALVCYRDTLESEGSSLVTAEFVLPAEEVRYRDLLYDIASRCRYIVKSELRKALVRKVTKRRNTLADASEEKERQDKRDFGAYLKQCTDSQVRGVYEKERDAGRATYAELARHEAELRNVALD